MSEFINNSKVRIDQLKSLILKLHKNQDVEATRQELTKLMGSVPYGEVVQAEEELIKEGLDREEVLKFCDLHTEALKGNLDSTLSKNIPDGHPLDVMMKENGEIRKVLDDIEAVFETNSNRKSDEDCKDLLTALNSHFNSLMDIEKHYLKKENLLFPYLEKYDITGPPMVMWGKDDEVRDLLKSSHLLFREEAQISKDVLEGFIELIFKPTINAIDGMIYKENQILIPMSLDTLTEIDWFNISEQSEEIGYCLYYPELKWTPDVLPEESNKKINDGNIRLSTGSFSKEELECMINSLPLDITFVDKEDKVKYFSHGKERIFQRSKSILGRLVQYCHPPSSVHIVNQIVDDFKTGKQDSAKFWINMGGKFIHIAYYAVRSNEGEYLGTAELSQTIDEYRKIDGERRILQYDD